ncbi:RagB/SusD family nutrient uptake outer membrane protein (plasmid) [Pedobacter sp. BS3]|uniref:RagB/SusD family nutrient uptake outer membrane protein n=1 Tax=Pedobacter sp. BS3 TaxID=2567937 RepID=UPI0011EFF331|nr:RagB/SusD family nutrient uptake outer membrane protein [Pedobacter sp. BS3]TZF86377.1 RagB/SusD family nutrient uptake outer membrane protein [Pedobacter sp. BS3]
MKRIIISALSIVMLLLGSCEKFLDTKPKDFLSPVTYYETEEQLNYALNAVYATLISFNTYGNAMHGYMGLQADEGWFRRTGGVQVYNVVTSDPYITKLWAEFYKGINNANLLLENINKPEMDEEKRKVIKGEAQFLRAYFYLILVNNFGNIPLKLKSTTSPGEPNIPQTPAKEVYEFILKEMIEAEKLVLPINEIGFGGRVSKSAVQGIIARTCLYMAGNPINDVSKYEDARTWAKKVIDSKLHALNPSYKQVFINYAQDIYDIKESIWEVEFWGNREPPYEQAGRIGTNFGVLYNGSTTESGVSYGWVQGTRWLYDSYETGDLRRDWCIAPYTISNGVEVARPATSRLFRYAGKWYRKYEAAGAREYPNSCLNFVLLRYSDVLLMFAEADNYLNGPTAEAYSALNQIRRRAFGMSPIPLTENTIFASWKLDTEAGSGGVLQDDEGEYNLTEQVTFANGTWSGYSSAYPSVLDIRDRAWVCEGYFKTTNTALQNIAGTRSTYSSYSGWDLVMLATGSVRFLVSKGSGQATASVSTPTSLNLRDGERHHFEVKWNPDDGALGKITLIIDGTNEYSADGVGDLGANTNRRFSIGSDIYASGPNLLKRYLWNGNLSDFKFYYPPEPAGASGIELSGFTKESLQEYIMAERARELCYEGLRKSDLRRWGNFVERMKIGVDEFAIEAPTNAGVEYFKNATARDVLWPIPEQERGLNPLLDQNYGW